MIVNGITFAAPVSGDHQSYQFDVQCGVSCTVSVDFHLFPRVITRHSLAIRSGPKCYGGVKDLR